MKYVPLPDKELGVVGAIGNLTLALYATVGTRLQIDAQLAALSPHERAAIMRMSGNPDLLAAAAAQPSPPGPGSAAGTSSSVGERDAAARLAGLGDTPLRATVENDLAPAPTVGRVTQLPENDQRDPNEVLIEHVRPGDRVASVEELVERNNGSSDLLDQMAPVPEVDGVPVERELTSETNIELG